MQKEVYSAGGRCSVDDQVGAMIDSIDEIEGAHSCGFAEVEMLEA